MRNGILGLMGEIIVKVLCKDDLDDAGRKLRDQLLDKMEVLLFYLFQSVSNLLSCLLAATSGLLCTNRGHLKFN